MTKVIAALDNSLAATPVLTTATALGDLFGAAVEAMHVRVDGDGDVATSAAERAGVPLRVLEGGPVERLVEAVNAEADVAALVLGARGTRLGKRPLGATALAVATAVARPVVVVPPDAPHPDRMHRVLVPLEGTTSTTVAPRAVMELAGDTSIDVVVLHVQGEDSLASFSDQPQHEDAAWADEFLARYCPWGVGEVRLELRVGRRDEVVPGVADEIDADLIVVAWSRELAAGRAPVVQAVLAHTVPVLLVPVAARSLATDLDALLPGHVVPS